jgi:hypothetical protein
MNGDTQNGRVVLEPRRTGVRRFKLSTDQLTGLRVLRLLAGASRSSRKDLKQILLSPECPSASVKMNNPAQRSNSLIHKRLL